MFFDPRVDVAVLRSSLERRNWYEVFFLREVSLNVYVDNGVVYCWDIQMWGHIAWLTALSCHIKGCRQGEELERSQCTYMCLPTRSQQIFLVTHQMHWYNFTPSPAVTAPRSSFADIQRRLCGTVFAEHFDLSLVGEDILDDDTITFAKTFVCRCQVHETLEDSWDLAYVKRQFLQKSD